jgi:hypothetical protein
MRIGKYALMILENKNLSISTYLVPNGGSKQSPYDPNKPTTAVGFTPNSYGRYTVEITNQRDDVVTDIETYIPIPRAGLNF